MWADVLRYGCNMTKLKTWWRAVRPFAYPASVVPAILGAVVAWSDGIAINYGLAALALIGAVAAHTGANLMNDYVDFRKGVDRPGTQGGSGVLPEGILTPSAILFASVIFFAVAGSMAIPLCALVGWPLAVLIALGFVAGAGYVLPPFGFKYRAMGDLIVFAAFGIGITLGSYMVQSRAFSLSAIPYAIPIGLIVAAILHANNMRDVADDRAVSVRTLAVLLGFSASRIFYVAMVLGSYLLLLLFFLAGIVNPGALGALATFPLAARITSQVWRSSPGCKAIAAAVEQTAQLNLIFGVAMTGGIVVFSLL